MVDARPSGGREFWNSSAEALASAEQIARQRANDGAAAFAELSPSDRRDAAEAIALLDGTGPLLDAARAFIRETNRQRLLAAVPTVAEAIDQYLAAKRQEAARGDIAKLTIFDLESKMRTVSAVLGGLKVTDLDEAAILKFLRNLSQSPRSKKDIRTKLSQLLNYCRREGKWIAANPLENLRLERVKAREVTIFSIDEVQRLIGAAVASDYPASVIPYLAVQLFAGLRPFEAQRLRWEFVHFETGQLEVKAATSKTRETRFVPLEPLLAEALMSLQDGPRIDHWPDVQGDAPSG
jgi:integrase